MLINRDFSGKLNLDVQDFKVPTGDYTYALNITKDSLGEGQDRVVANILGNRKVTYTLPSGDNKVIGQYPDLVRNKVYYFVWNSNNFHSILAYDRNADTISKILVSKTDSGGIDILAFNPSYKVNSINVIHRDESEGDLLFFNDGLNEPRRINVSSSYALWTSELIAVAKPAPQMPPKVVYENELGQSDVFTTILDASRSDALSLFQGGVQTDFASFPSLVTSVFNANLAFTEFTYTGSTILTRISVNLNLFFNFTGNVLVRITVNGNDVAATDQIISGSFGGFNYTKTPIITLNTNDVVSVKLTSTEPITYPAKFFNLVTASLDIEKVDTVSVSQTVNNLKNRLFQFSYRWVFDNYEKSVWSEFSEVPLPFDYDNTYADDPSKNSKIAVYFSTGGIDVKKIELAVRQIIDGGTTDWQLFEVVDKSELSLNDDDFHVTRFKNDGLYTPIDVTEFNEIQDYVPLKANAAEMLNGNTPIYGGITEGYNKINADISVNTSNGLSSFFTSYAGTLFTAFCNGVDSGSAGTQIKIVLNGFKTGTEELQNGKARYIVNAINSSGVNVGVEYAYTSSDNVDVSTILSNIQSLLISSGWTFSSLSDGVLTMNYAGGFTLLSSGLKQDVNSINRQTVQFAYPFDAGATFELMYFDSNGRTNGVTYDVDGNFKTPADNNSIDFSQPQLVINHRPPTWAAYYKVVRTNNTTYEKRLQWISDSAYSDSSATPSGDRYVYIGISNIELYNNQIEGSKGIVSYSYQQGDRLRILNRYSALGVLNPVQQADYEIIGLAVNPVINGSEYSGNFVKIKYPDSLPAGILFDGTQNYQNYEILLYSIRQRAADTKRLYFEFGKCFGIGNSGTANAFHIGLDQTQSADLATPAKITLANGDLFFRRRRIPLGTRKVFTAGLYTTNSGVVSPYWTIPVTVGSVVNGNFTFASQSNTGASISAGAYPTNANTDCIFNNTGANPCFLRLAGTVPMYSDLSCSYALVVKITTASTTTVQQIMDAQSVTLPNETYNFTFDKTITVPANAKVFLLSYVLGRTTTPPTVGVGAFNLTAEAYTSLEIPIIEASFSDTYNLVGNSNGRASAVDENAKQTYYPTLVRFGQSYQADTSINGTNRFLFDNFDTYDRSFGDIRRLHVRDRYMKVYQKFKVGNVPVLTQIVKDVQGNPLQAESDRLINKIQYYSGEYGIGDSPNSLAWNNFADYFVDDYRGVVCRLGQEGITPLSIVHETNAFFVDKLKAYRSDLNNGIAAAGQTYKGNPQVYGVFDASTNKYIVMMEQITRYSNPSTISFQQDGYTISFDERLNGFESFYSWKPEGATCLGTLLISFKNGELWKHDSTTYCNFYGVQYEAEVDGAFNDNMLQKKTFMAISELSSAVWSCPEISTQMYSYGTTKQQSNLIAGDFRLKEGQYHASFRRDANSIGGLVNGKTLKGQYILIKFRATNPSQFVYLSGVSVKYIPSPLTNR